MALPWIAMTRTPAVLQLWSSHLGGGLQRLAWGIAVVLRQSWLYQAIMPWSGQSLCSQLPVMWQIEDAVRTDQVRPAQTVGEQSAMQLLLESHRSRRCER